MRVANRRLPIRHIICQSPHRYLDRRVEAPKRPDMTNIFQMWMGPDRDRAKTLCIFKSFFGARR